MVWFVRIIHIRTICVVGESVAWQQRSLTHIIPVTAPWRTSLLKKSTAVLFFASRSSAPSRYWRVSAMVNQWSPWPWVATV